MKKIAGILVLVMLCSVLVIGCQSSESEEDAIKAVMEGNLEAFNNEDLDKYMEAISKNSEVYEMTEQTTKAIFDAYELETKIESMEVIEINDDTAKLEVVQTTRKIEGPEFKNSKITAIQTFKKEDGEWKVYTSEIKNLEYID